MADDWARAGAYIRRRRKSLVMNQFELGDAAGLGRSTVQKLEAGTASPEAGTLRKLDRALNWQPGSIAAVAAGGEPTPIPADMRTESEWRRDEVSDDDLVGLIHRVVYEAVIVAAPDTPLSRVREIEERALDAARRAGFGPLRRRQAPNTKDDDPEA